MARQYRYPAPEAPVPLIAECFDPDFEAGKLYWRTRPLSHFVSEHAALAFNAKHAGREAIINVHPAGYRAGRITFNGEGYCVRRCRIIWALFYGAWPTMQIGHRNQDFGDDRIENLREQSGSQRGAYGRHRPGRSGLRGIHLNDIGGYVANVGVGGRMRYIGTFDTVEQAIAARNAAAIAIHGDFARLTTPPQQIAA